MHVEYARTMAVYNQWMNEKLFGVCATLTDEERKKDRRAFFCSIHGTLNHLLIGDLIWMGRFTGEPFQVKGLDEEIHTDFEELLAHRVTLDAEIIAWASGLTEYALNSPFSFTSFVNPRNRQCTLWKAVLHFFNHQTHHRGQLTCLFSQCGLDYGVTDLLWMTGILKDARPAKPI